jgi:hypothetical protein
MATYRLKVTAPLERGAAADLFRHTLSRIPSVFGRLLYLGSLRDPHTGAYRHDGLAAAFGPDLSQQALRLSHNRVFREWLRMSLEQKHSDLSAYLDTLESPRSKVVNYWLESETYRSCVPGAASRAERAYFSSDVEELLELISFAAGGSRARKSSRPR